MNSELQIKSILETFNKLVNFNFSQKAIETENNSELDAISKNLNHISDIILQKRTKEAYSANFNELYYYKYALDKASIVAITDQKGIITYVNDNFCKISKYSQEELLGQDHRIVNSKFHNKEFIRNIWQTIANGKVWKGEIQNKDKNGQFYWVDTSIIPFLNKNGKPYQYLSIRTDITSRKIAEDNLRLNHEDLEKKVLNRTSQLTSIIETLTSNKQQLKESESFNKGILNSLTSHIAVVNRVGEIVAVNDAWNKFAINNKGNTLSSTGVGANYFTICENAIAGGDVIAKRVLSGMRNVMDAKIELFQYEYPCHSPNLQRWFLMRVMKFESNQTMIVVSHTDITERKLAEEKIKFHSNLLQAVEEAVVATDIYGKIIYWNKAAEKIYGWKKEETMGKNIVDFVLYDQVKIKGMAILELLLGGQAWSGELMVQRKNGEHFKIWISNSIVQNENSEFIGIIAVSMDITENVKAREDLLQINERYNLVAKATNDSIWELDVNTGKALRLGEGFKVLFGYEKGIQNSEELDYNNLVHPDDLVMLKESMTQAYNNQNENYWEHNYRFLKANGEYAYIYDRGYIIRDENGIAVKMIGASQDITDRIRHIKAIEEQNRKLKEISWIQSHVVRAPLSRMMGIVNLLEEEELNSDEFKTWVKYFVDSSKELDNIIKDITVKSNSIDLSDSI